LLAIRRASAEVRLAEVRLVEVRLAEVRFAEVRTTEVRSAFGDKADPRRNSRRLNCCAEKRACQGNTICRSRRKTTHDSGD
jgi:hypothetical protein